MARSQSGTAACFISTTAWRAGVIWGRCSSVGGQPYRGDGVCYGRGGFGGGRGAWEPCCTAFRTHAHTQAPLKHMFPVMHTRCAHTHAWYACDTHTRVVRNFAHTQASSLLWGWWTFCRAACQVCTCSGTRTGRGSHQADTAHCRRSAGCSRSVDHALAQYCLSSWEDGFGWHAVGHVFGPAHTRARLSA